MSLVDEHSSQPETRSSEATLTPTKIIQRLNHPCVNASAATKNTTLPSSTPRTPLILFILFIFTLIECIFGLFTREFGNLTVVFNGFNVGINVFYDVSELGCESNGGTANTSGPTSPAQCEATIAGGLPTIMFITCCTSRTTSEFVYGDGGAGTDAAALEFGSIINLLSILRAKLVFLDASSYVAFLIFVCLCVLRCLCFFLSFFFCWNFFFCNWCTRVYLFCFLFVWCI